MRARGTSRANWPLKVGEARAADVPEQWHAEAGTTTAGTLGLARTGPLSTCFRGFCRSCAAIKPRSAAGSIAQVGCRPRRGCPCCATGQGRCPSVFEPSIVDADLGARARVQNYGRTAGGATIRPVLPLSGVLLPSLCGPMQPWCAKARGDQGPADAGAYSVGFPERARTAGVDPWDRGSSRGLIGSARVRGGTPLPGYGRTLTRVAPDARTRCPSRTGQVDDAAPARSSSNGELAELARGATEGDVSRETLPSGSSRTRPSASRVFAGKNADEMERLGCTRIRAQTLSTRSWIEENAPDSPTERLLTCCRRRSRRHCAFRAVALQRSDRAGFACSGPLARRSCGRTSGARAAAERYGATACGARRALRCGPVAGRDVRLRRLALHDKGPSRDLAHRWPFTGPCFT